MLQKGSINLYTLKQKGMESMQVNFVTIHDPRHQGYVKYKLDHILIIIMAAVLCGLDELCTITEFANNKAEFFRKNFGIESIPSKPTFSRILSIIDGKEVATAILEIMKEKVTGREEIIAIDGKAICSTTQKNKSHSALQIISAYLTESGVILGQEKINNKTNEIPVLQEMLSYLNVENKIITADAMHCQRETCKIITEKKGHYVIGLKANQKALYEDVKLYFENPPADFKPEIYTTKEKSHGRIEKRVCKKVSEISWLKERHNWVGLESVFSIERTISDSKGTSKEVSYYISSKKVSAEKLLNIAREHWKIESLHWLLDVVFNEDESKYASENAHITLNAMRKLALLKHKSYLSDKKKKPSLKGNMFKALLNEKLLLEIIAV